MTKWLLQHEPAVRGGAFLGVLLVVGLWEWAVPRRVRVASKSLRWLNNFGLIAVNTALLRLVFPAGAVAVALLAEDRGWGLLNNITAVHIPAWLAVGGSVLLLDFAIYLQHVLFHAVPTLWRLHRVHHADVDIDVTTGARFHTVEILLSMGIKIGVVAALGPPAVAVLIFEVLLNATAMFNHGNVRLPLALDRVLRMLMVTPDMHRVHHSVIPRETNSNFGFNMPWWDRLMGTYRAQPIAGHEGMCIGLEELQHAKRQWLPWLLALPVTGGVGRYAIDATPDSATVDCKDTEGGSDHDADGEDKTG